MPDKVRDSAGPTRAEGSARADGAAEADNPLGIKLGIKGLAARMAAGAAMLRAKWPAQGAGEMAWRAARATDTPTGGRADTTADDAKDAGEAAAPVPTLPGGSAKAAATPTPEAQKQGGAHGLIGRLNADERIRQAAGRHERALWAGAAAATLVYALLIAGQMAGFAVLLPPEEVQQQRERRGQGAPDSISVEIVPDPDHSSKTTRWREGSDVPAPQPMEQPPQPPQQEARAEPEPQPQPAETEPTNEKSDEPRDADSPMLLDIDSLVDAAAQDLKRQIDDHYDKKKQAQQQRRQQQTAAAGAMQIRGTGASGKSDPFTRRVIAALMKTRPGPFALWGRVLVSFQITETGQLLYVRVLQSSGNSALDEAAVDAIKRAQFKRPPPGLTPNDRTYIIDYIFG